MFDPFGNVHLSEVEGSEQSCVAVNQEPTTFRSLTFDHFIDKLEGSTYYHLTRSGWANWLVFFPFH